MIDMSINHRKHASIGRVPYRAVAPSMKGGFRLGSKDEQRAVDRARLAQDRKPGPARSAPMFYAGETYNGRKTQYPDVERHPNGALASKHNKGMRRLIRAALKRTYSSLTKHLRVAQGLRAQAYEAARDEKRSGRWARRLLAKELKIHQAVYAPDGKALRKLRTEKRARVRKGLAADPIAALVDKMASK